MKTNLLTFFLFFALLYTNAQKLELGKVSIAELQEKTHPKDSSATAAILFKKGEVRFEYTQEHGFEMVTNVKTRIKIYKKEGYEWANQSVAYYIGNSTRDKVSFSGANTFNLVDGKIVKTKLKSDGEFEEIINKYWGRKKIAMPNVKEGSIIEYEYTHRTPRIVELKEWFFQTSIPVNYSEFITFIPEYYVYKPNQKGFIFPKVTVDKMMRRIDYTYTEKASPGIGGQSVSSRSQETLEFMETKTAFVAENLPAMKDEAFVNNIINYTASVSHELSMTKFPYSTIEMYATDWESVTKNIYDNDDFGIELNKTGYFEEDVELLLKGITRPEDKILAIFEFVKSKVKWNEFNGYSCNDGVKKAYKDKVGNVAEINLMLTAMLRYAGLNANPVIISTRSNGIALFPSRAAFNYVISAVEINNGLVLLDATDKYSLPNILPIRDLNWSGRLIRKDGTSTEVDLMPKIASSNSVNMNYAIDDKGGVSGKIRRQKTDYEAMVFRAVNNVIKEESYLEKLESENENIEISDYTRANGNDIKLPVIENLSFSGPSLSEIIGGKIYVNPLLFFAFKQNPFKQEVREYPVDYEYPNLKKYSINIQIPEGYKIETLPKSAAFTMEDNLGSFKYIVNNTENGIQILVVEQINAAIIPSEYYSMLKDFYQEIVKKETEKMVIAKI